MEDEKTQQEDQVLPLALPAICMRTTKTDGPWTQTAAQTFPRLPWLLGKGCPAKPRPLAGACMALIETSCPLVYKGHTTRELQK